MNWFQFVLLTISFVLTSNIPVPCDIPKQFFRQNSLFDSEKICKNAISDIQLKFCDEIKQLMKQIDICNLGSVWNLKELRDKLNEKIQNMPISNDVCSDFRILEIKHIYDKNSIGKTLTDVERCKMLCRNNNLCPFILNLYWIKSVLSTFKTELNVTKLPDFIQSSTVSDAKITVTIAATVQDSKVYLKQIDNFNEKSINSVTKNEPTKSSESLSKNNLNSQSTLDNSDSKNEADISRTLTNDITKKQHIISPTTVKYPQQKNSADENLKQKQQKSNELTDLTSNPENKKSQKVGAQSKIESQTVDMKTEIKETYTFNENEITDDNSNVGNINVKSDEKNVKNEINTSEALKVNNNIDINPEGENKNKIENQVNDFNDEFADPGNEYTDEDSRQEDSLDILKPKEEVSKNSVSENLTNKKGIVLQIPTFPEEEDSHFFAYFLTVVVLCIAGYLIFHNKQKIMALIIEGRHERRRRPNSGSYKRLDSKDTTKATSHVIF